MEIIMKTFYGDDGNYADIPLSKILDRMTDDWIDDDVTGENISELRDACRKLLETAHNSEYTKPGRCEHAKSGCCEEEKEEGNGLD